MTATTLAVETTSPFVATAMASHLAGRTFTFGITDYNVFVFMLFTSTVVGVYFGFFSKSKNTTDEYLLGGKRMKTIPIAVSLVASQLSALSITSVPAENYSFGFNYIFIVISMVVVAPILCYVITPVFYENNISNCYEYLERRFNKRTRQLVTCTFILNSFLMLPVIIFIPSMAFAQVSGINIHLVNAAVCSICVFYTMLGGIKAVVWTDVIQAAVMISSVLLIGILGAHKTGGLAKVFEYASEGGRMDINFSFDPRVRITFWNSFICGGLMWTGHIGLNQSCVQRIVSLPSLRHAQRSLWLAAMGFIVVMACNCFIGIVMYAYYRSCDPLKAGLVDKLDKMVPFFVQDIVGHLTGMPGLFISCVFSAALSTMSAILNSLAGVVYFDYIRPHAKKYHTEERANTIMKIFVVAMGFYCVAGGFIVQRFDSILQLIITITGINTGAVVGVFILGMLVPRTNGKVAVASIIFSVVGMCWIIVNGQIHAIKYVPLPTSVDSCDALDLRVVINSSFSVTENVQRAVLAQQTEVPKLTTSYDNNREFSIYEISFYWYKVVGFLLVWLLAIPLSYVWPHADQEKLNPHLFSPFVRRFINNRSPVEMEELPLQAPFAQTATADYARMKQTAIKIAMPEKQTNSN